MLSHVIHPFEGPSEQSMQAHYVMFVIMAIWTLGIPCRMQCSPMMLPEQPDSVLTHSGR
jgi:hypothetical protein